MDTLLTPEVITLIGGLLATGILGTLTYLMNKAVKAIEASENKVDDILLPAIKELEQRLSTDITVDTLEKDTAETPSE